MTTGDPHLDAVMDRYHGPYVCGHCGATWPCANLRRLRPPYLWPGGTDWRSVAHPSLKFGRLTA